MERIWTTDLLAYAGEQIWLAGWLHRSRRLGALSFIILRDGRGTAQVVVEDRTLVDQVERLTAETVVSIAGRVVGSNQAPNGVGLRAEHVHVLSKPVEHPPFDLFRPAIAAQTPTMLDPAPVALHHPRLRRRVRLMTAALSGFRARIAGLDFTEISTPKIFASAIESGADVFRIDYFGRPAYLAQSPQFYVQTMVGVFERVYEVGPVFTSEPHDTPRHLNEYVPIDADIGFIKDHASVMEVVTQVMAGTPDEVRTAFLIDITSDIVKLPCYPETIPSIHFTDAQNLISSATGEDLSKELGVAPSHQR